MTTTRRFYKMVDRLGEEVPIGKVEDARAFYAAADEAVQQAFLFRVAGHLTRRLADERWDPVAHSGEVLADWFLTPAEGGEGGWRWRASSSACSS